MFQTLWGTWFPTNLQSRGFNLLAIVRQVQVGQSPLSWAQLIKIKRNKNNYSKAEYPIGSVKV